MMKRSRVESEIQALDMADCLISLSKSKDSNSAARVFVCKTCNREFSSFQALGGHRASHRKPRLSPAAGDDLQNYAMKTKAHGCSICGVEFSVGQALGGHMRRHRNSSPAADGPAAPAQSVSDDSDCDGGFIGLDLNLTPLENDLVRLQLMAPPVGCFT